MEYKEDEVTRQHNDGSLLCGKMDLMIVAERTVQKDCVHKERVP